MSALHTNYGVSAAETFSTSSPQTLVTDTIGVNRGGAGHSWVAARRVSDGATKVFHIEFGFKRDGNGLTVFGVSLLNALGTVGDLLALATVTATVDAADDDLRVRVTGLASQDIDWAANITGLSVDHE